MWLARYDVLKLVLMFHVVSREKRVESNMIDWIKSVQLEPIMQMVPKGIIELKMESATQTLSDA